MKKSFMCSLCHGGIIGGGLYLDDEKITYKTNKLTVDSKYKRISLPLDKINDVTWKWIIFPIATFKMSDGNNYTFIIFNKRRFIKHYTEIRGSAS